VLLLGLAPTNRLLRSGSKFIEDGDKEFPKCHVLRINSDNGHGLRLKKLNTNYEYSTMPIAKMK
jgi:hypothetical protein